MRSGFSTRSTRFAYGLWEQIRQQQQGYSGLVRGARTASICLSGGEARHGKPVRSMAASSVTSELNALLGRTLTDEDDCIVARSAVQPGRGVPPTRRCQNA